jgi:hypothetical protein
VRQSIYAYDEVPPEIRAAMSAQEDLITAAKSLRDQGHTAFSLADILSTARRYGSTYPDPVLKSTLATMLKTEDNAAQDGVIFVEVRRGYYRMTR